MVSKEVLQLAENLKKNGLATSQDEAVRKAEMMLGQSFASKPEQPVAHNETPKEYDISKEEKPLRELMPGKPVDLEAKKMVHEDIPKQESAPITAEQIQEHPREEPNPEQSKQIHEQTKEEPKQKEKKYVEEQIDLSEVFKAKRD